MGNVSKVFSRTLFTLMVKNITPNAVVKIGLYLD